MFFFAQNLFAFCTNDTCLCFNKVCSILDSFLVTVFDEAASKQNQMSFDQDSHQIFTLCKLKNVIWLCELQFLTA